MAPPAVAASLMLLLLLASLPAEAPQPPASGPHIADVNVLLPPRMTNPVEYRLRASDGCFTWSWDHHDTLSVQPEFNGSRQCSTSARLLSIAPYNNRKETAVYATDLRSGTTIRVKVIIDIISRIQIFHRAVKIDLDELAALRIRAFDDEENEFSSLVGLQFLWQLTPKSTEADSIHYLVHVPLKETPLSDCGGFCGDLDTQVELEDKGVGSDLYVMKGTGIGHEVVSAQLLEPGLEHIVDKIVLTVAEAMSLDPPSPVYVTVGALIYYSLRVIRQNTPQVIDLPSPHHQWSVMNSSVVRVDSMLGIAHALNLGITNIIVEDTRLSGHIQISSMHVVVPDRLCIYIVPVSHSLDPLEGTKPTPSSVIWYVFPGQNYIIHMKVFSQGSDANEIRITENNELKLESDAPKYWDIISVPAGVATTYEWQNSRLLKPVSLGQGSMTASLTYHCGSSEMAEVLSVEQKVLVCDKVKFSIVEEDEYLSKIIRLPWVPGVYQEVDLKATGGCGKRLEDYNWFSSDITTISVSASGIARATRPGQAIVKVVSIFDPINYAEVVIEVLIPSSMVMLPIFPVEVVIGTQLQAAVDLETSSGNYFHRCDAFNTFVRWEVFSETESFKILNTTEKVPNADMLLIEGSKPLSGHPCAWIYLHACRAGPAVLHATFSSELRSSSNSMNGPIILKAASTIAAYSPLIARQAGNGNQFGGYWVDFERLHAGILDSDYPAWNELYLVPGSGMDVVLLGGPERWDERVEYIETVQILGEQDLAVTDGVLVHRSSSGDGRLYKVLCQRFGDFRLLFSRGNLVGDDHPMPAVANAELSIICSFPSSITLIANELVNSLDIIEAATRADRGPGRIHTSSVIVANGCTIRVAAIGIHSTGRPFSNSSSLCLRWELSGCEELAYWNDFDSFEGSGGTAWERFLFLQNASGLCTVRATVIEFSETMANHLHEKAYLPFETVENNLTDAIPLQLVSSLRIIPESVLLVFNPEAEVNLSVTGGTCFLDVVMNDTQVTQIIQPPKGAGCSHLTFRPRGLGVALVTVRDVGLSPPATATAFVKVANVDWIKVISQGEMSIMEGTTKSFNILAGTQDGSVFDSSQYKYMGIHVHLEDNALELINKDDSSISGGWLVSGPYFSVKGVAPGVTTLYVSARQRSGHKIFSQSVKVEVYKPLRVHPEYVFLVPGASYLLTVKGGPKIGAFVEYSSMHEETVIVQRSSGRISTITIGNATVRASAYGIGGTLICEAFGRVEVQIPSAMIFNLQSDQLCVGCKMPIFPSFPKGNLFSFYEICKDYMWTVENEKVLSFQMIRSLDSDMYAVQSSCAEGNNNPCYPDDNGSGFINSILGCSAGRTKVFVSLTCDFVSSGTPKPVSYSTSVFVTVIPDPPLALGMPITWVLPPFYTTSDLLPESSDPYVQLDSNGNKKNTIYSVLRPYGRNDVSRQEAITIDGSNIRTKESNDLICIQAKDQATGRTEIASCVRVAEVAQVRVTTTESPFPMVYLAVHAKLELIISYCDDLGYPFYEAHGVVPLEIETNYPDVVSILMPKTDNISHFGNENVIIKARSPGRALLRISINHNPQKADFIMVSVGAQLYPRNPILHVGRYLNLTIIGDGMDALGSGQWISGNESVLSVNEISGEVHARGEGVALVIFEGSNFKLRTKITVLKVDQIVVEAPAETLTNVPFPPKGYKFSVKFSDPLSHKLEATGNGILVPYDCRVDPPYVGYAKPWIDHGNGNSYCLFFPYSPKHLLSIMSNSKSMRSKEISSSEGFMYISIIASLRETPNITGSAHAPFVGGFAIADIGKLNLTPNSNRTLITVLGNADVEIYWNAKDQLSIIPLRRDGSGIGERVQYEVEAVEGQRFTDKIIIVLPATGQTEEIDVSYELGESPAPARLGAIAWIAILVCVVVLVLTVYIFMGLLDKPDRSIPSALERAAPLEVATAAAAASNIQSSPRTPQPFMEYVRRTVDETPYYKRDRRRRFDPQNTY